MMRGRRLRRLTVEETCRVGYFPRDPHDLSADFLEAAAALPVELIICGTYVFCDAWLERLVNGPPDSAALRDLTLPVANA